MGGLPTRADAHRMGRSDAIVRSAGETGDGRPHLLRRCSVRGALLGARAWLGARLLLAASCRLARPSPIHGGCAGPARRVAGVAGWVSCAMVLLSWRS